MKYILIALAILLWGSVCQADAIDDIVLDYDLMESTMNINTHVYYKGKETYRVTRATSQDWRYCHNAFPTWAKCWKNGKLIKEITYEIPKGWKHDKLCSYPNCELRFLSGR